MQVTGHWWVLLPLKTSLTSPGGLARRKLHAILTLSSIDTSISAKVNEKAKAGSKSAFYVYKVRAMAAALI